MPKENGAMMQHFHWYSKDDGSLWRTVTEEAPNLAEAGFTAIWLPPSYKGTGGGQDVGYGVYDMYDLGEFDQKGSVRTKYGTKDEYVNAVKALQDNGIHAYADIVMNHRMGGDEAEPAKAIPHSKSNRLQPNGELKDVSTFTHFKFPGRNGKYSKFEWHWNHFNAVDYDDSNPDDQDSIFLFEGKKFDEQVSKENANFDYLMGSDLDFDVEEVRNEMIEWGQWYIDTTNIDGFRLDAVKHIPAWYIPQWLEAMNKHKKTDMFAVAEYWENGLDNLKKYLHHSKGQVSLFDVPLHYNFRTASIKGGGFDMRKIFDGTLVQDCPDLAVTFVANHDSQALQDLESVVESWFKPMAYALILLRQQGYPCVFEADYYGAEYTDDGKDGEQYTIHMPSHRYLIDKFLYARKHFAYGQQNDYFDHQDCLGWTCLGDEGHEGTMAVILTDAGEDSKHMETGKPNTSYVDITGHIEESVTTDENGWAEFKCDGGSVSVWVEADKTSL
ncbi:alpha-amylase [Sphaeroforma arctica JP610]|uniref:Alpha-amylase n=1 Tax=Sphaeroforma arctica JP610 TaxID=667725 RepID=A0A0L0GA60_9EUKA|nr:alpha-amylase [Sphaeroforma arctica JP610]KNC85123.1 alpha-amylase [Sphaeroforma arctica JP610]|eukprot:XP_014159025.1 alpha-amylase [Sphaeroforma arctica JP610]